MPLEGRPTRICPGTPSLQHLHLLPANHRLQKVYIRWRCSNHACWWRLAGSGRGTEQRHGNRLYTSRPGSWSSELQKRCPQCYTSTTRKLNVSQMSTTTMKLCRIVSSQIPRSYVGQVTHISPTSGVFKPNATVMCKCSASKGTPNKQL